MPSCSLVIACLFGGSVAWCQPPDVLFDAVEIESSENDAVDAPPVEQQRVVRVALVGNTLIEREQRYGYWETLVVAADPDTRYEFRNLGWSGDTVQGEARAGFGTPADGYDKLVEQVRSVKPDVLVVGYGSNAAFAGPSGVSTFVSGMNRLLNDVTARANPRLMLLSPPAYTSVRV